MSPMAIGSLGGDGGMISQEMKDLDMDGPADIGGHNVTKSVRIITLDPSPEAERPGFSFGSIDIFVGFERELAPMTPHRVKEIREKLGLSQAALGEALRLGSHGKRTVARWESGGTIPGPVQLALEALYDGWRPGDGRYEELRSEYLKVLDSISNAVSEAYNRVQVVGQLKDSEPPTGTDEHGA